MMRLTGLRPRVGVSTICFRLMEIDRSELSVATCTVLALTSTEVVTSPTSSRMSCRSTLSCVATMIPFWS